jgi:uncharacterized membrane protein YdjX (TVP38/TMEM64 family)
VVGKHGDISASCLYCLLYPGNFAHLAFNASKLNRRRDFRIYWGTLWTTLAALVAAIAAFAFTRTIGRELVSQKLAGHWSMIDAEIRQGGLFYLFAIRLLPIIPYGIVNFVAGLTSIKFKDYLIGTLFGTLPGVFPFVMMGAGK